MQSDILRGLFNKPLDHAVTEHIRKLDAAYQLIEALLGPHDFSFGR